MPSCRPARSRVPRSVAALTAVATLVAAGTATYTVRRGDTLTSIAAQHDTTVSALAASNDLGNPHFILEGSALKISGAAGSSGKEATPDVEHVVAAGETLSGIASRYRADLGEIASANGLSAPYTIIEGQRLALPGAGAAAPVAASSSRDDVGALIDRVAGEYGWDPAIVKALAWQESGWNNQVVSSAGAIGIMQVMPATGEFIEDYLVRRELDLTDPVDNVTAGVAFLDHLHRITGGDTERMLGGYYQGLRSIQDNGYYTDTEQYIANVLSLRERY